MAPDRLTREALKDHIWLWFMKRSHQDEQPFGAAADLFGAVIDTLEECCQLIEKDHQPFYRDIQTSIYPILERIEYVRKQTPSR